jgi:hypothetical protein
MTHGRRKGLVAIWTWAGEVIRKAAPMNFDQGLRPRPRSLPLLGQDYLLKIPPMERRAAFTARPIPAPDRRSGRYPALP